MKDWYDLLWNNETGQLNYKGNLVSTVVIDVHDLSLIEKKQIKKLLKHSPDDGDAFGLALVNPSGMFEVEKQSGPSELDMKYLARSLLNAGSYGGKWD